jgi:hypothetical protein
MPNVPLARSDYFRGVAKEARIRTRNRYFEQNPVLYPENTALIARPGKHRWISVGDGPIRGIYSQPGSFTDDLFVASGENLYRVAADETVTLIGALPASSSLSAVRMAATSNIGETPAYLFVAAGTSLMLYVEDGYALGTISGTPANTDVVRLGSTYYSFTNGSVNAGTPAGTVGNPWLVALGASAAEAWENFADAIRATGVAGTQYSTALTANVDATVVNFTSSEVVVRSLFLGALGNTTATTETGGAISWTAATLTGGGDPSWTQVQTPDDVGIIDVGYIASYVVVIPAQGQGINGRFYWINPGETTIDALDFATAEQSPDPIANVVVFGDQFWLAGTNKTEVWYFSGNIDAPVLRMRGVAFDRGAWEGTAIQVKDSMILVDNGGAVFQIAGGLKRISRPDVEERIRKAIQYQASQT